MEEEQGRGSLRTRVEKPCLVDMEMCVNVRETHLFHFHRHYLFFIISVSELDIMI